MKTPPQAPRNIIKPEPPAWLTPYAQEVWSETIKALEDEGRQLGILNAGALAGYCDSLGLVRECSEVLAREGMTIDGGREGQKRHPAVTTRISALNSLRGFATQLGLCPGTVSRLPEPEDDEPNPFANL